MPETNDQQPTTNDEGVSDPIAGKSMSGIMLVSALLMILSLFWAIYDEAFSQRPWKGMQREFVDLYSAHLKKLKPQQAAGEKKVRASSGFQELERKVKAAEDQAIPRLKQIDHDVVLIDHQLAAITTPFQDARAKIESIRYQIEVASSPDDKDDLRKEIEEFKQELIEVSWPSNPGTEDRELKYDELEKIYEDLKNKKAELLTERVKLLETASALRKERDDYFQENFAGLTPLQIDGLLKKMDEFQVDIKQINLAEMGLVDRCESCHLGVREPLVLTRKDMKGQAAFVSHPRDNFDYLKTHDPERFACSTCHNGNGRATTGVAKAHGNYKHWLWPLYAKENVQAGCVQCHVSDQVLDGAPVLSRGRELFQLKGCMGCHRYEGFDRETDALFAVRQSIRDLELKQRDNLLQSEQARQAGDKAESNQDAQRLYAKAENLKVVNSGLDAKIEMLDHQFKALLQDVKKMGPNLKEVQVKLRKEWIPVWLENPHAWRPTTKMPRFRLEKADREAITAFLWQSGLKYQAPAQPPGDATRGKELFETRGCLACHSMGEGAKARGGEFAANLSRLGEKANYNYIVRWIHNPRERTLPYCPTEKRDITAEDYQKKGLPFVFDLDHSRCPRCGHELQVQNMTVMPSLRLSEQDARDIAGFLMTQKRADAKYAAAPYMDDPKLKERGRQLVQTYGCAGCHEIAGFEEEGRIGTELTKEGSKPIERLDFALFTHDAKAGRLPDGKANVRNGEEESWYDHKGFFEQKLTNPAVYDRGKEKDPRDRLRMPNPNVTPQDITALTTFLLGSVDAAFPKNLFYNPTGAAKDIQEGWWVIKKYNCMGCHRVQIGQKSVLETAVPNYQTPEGRDQLPPSLTSEGARVNPEWLLKFLTNPAMSVTDTNRNGVRSYLQARMPTFHFSQNELRILVKFFMAVSSQPQYYFPPTLTPLTDQERQMARALFTSKAAPCLKCHITGDPSRDKTATAPNFLIAPERLKPGWTGRWLLDPQAVSPGTAMPSGLFRREGSRWVFAGPTPDLFKGYDKDHVDLLVRYMFQMTPDEQRRLVSVRVAGNTGAPAGERRAESEGQRAKSKRQRADANGQTKRFIPLAPSAHQGMFDTASIGFGMLPLIVFKLNRMRRRKKR
jgi:cytochrome c551/c552